MRRTRQPRRRRTRLTRRSRALFPASFLAQNAAFPCGRVPCHRHPCQKHPSTNTATRCRAKTKSGTTRNRTHSPETGSLSAKPASTTFPEAVPICVNNCTLRGHINRNDIFFNCYSIVEISFALHELLQPFDGIFRNASFRALFCVVDQREPVLFALNGHWALAHGVDVNTESALVSCRHEQNSACSNLEHKCFVVLVAWHRECTQEKHRRAPNQTGAIRARDQPR